MSKTSFVYEGTEVIKTGREAIREIKSMGGKPPRKMVLVEITPADGLDWKKWVDEGHLYVIGQTDK